MSLFARTQPSQRTRTLARAAAASSAEARVSREAVAAVDEAAAGLAGNWPSHGAAGSAPWKRLAAARGPSASHGLVKQFCQMGSRAGQRAATTATSSSCHI